ncbi:MAG: FAD-dependent monooxygenase, partial [Pseudomonadota bacterium]
MTEILIVGAGPTGLTAALAAHRHGFRPRIIERRDALSPLSRAVGLLPSSIEIFETLGVAAAIRTEAIEVEKVAFMVNGERAATLALATDPDPTMRLLSLPQDRTEAILEAALGERGIVVEYATPFESLAEVDGKVAVTAGGVTQAFHEVLGADGARSTVRTALGLEAKGFDLPEEWSIADVDLETPLERMARSYFDGPRSAVLVMPMGGRRARLVSNTPDALKIFDNRMPVERVRRAGTFKISIRQVDRYRVGHVSLAGDAAHTHSPVGGRGMNLGIADAAEWADRLAAGTLDDYSTARH